jgi:hypothetical protein
VSEKILAISIKQPWAALLVAGLKTVEVRTWATRVRGRVFIHAAKAADPRPDGWRLVTPELRPLAALRGGIIGAADLTACVRYRTAEQFAAAAEEHRNSPAWFAPTGLYGFVFQNPTQVAYTACPGRTLFFAAEGISLS